VSPEDRRAFTVGELADWLGGLDRRMHVYIQRTDAPTILATDPCRSAAVIPYRRERDSQVILSPFEWTE